MIFLCFDPDSLLLHTAFHNQDVCFGDGSKDSAFQAVQGQLDALEQRMLSKMDRALAKFLEKQLGKQPS